MIWNHPKIGGTSTFGDCKLGMVCCWVYSTSLHPLATRPHPLCVSKVVTSSDDGTARLWRLDGGALGTRVGMGEYLSIHNRGWCLETSSFRLEKLSPKCLRLAKLRNYRPNAFANLIYQKLLRHILWNDHPLFSVNRRALGSWAIKVEDQTWMLGALNSFPLTAPQTMV